MVLSLRHLLWNYILGISLLESSVQIGGLVFFFFISCFLIGFGGVTSQKYGQYSKKLDWIRLIHFTVKKDPGRSFTLSQLLLQSLVSLTLPFILISKQTSIFYDGVEKKPGQIRVATGSTEAQNPTGVHLFLNLGGFHRGTWWSECG